MFHAETFLWRDSMFAQTGGRGPLLMLALVLLGFGTLSGDRARAQAPDRGAGVRVGGVADDSDAASTTSGADGQVATSQSGRSESLLGSIGQASTPVITVTVVIAAMSFYLIAVIIWMALHYRASVVVPSDLVHHVQGLLEHSKFNEAYQRLTEDGSFLSRVLAAGRAQATGGDGPGAPPWSLPTRTRPWRWSTARPTSRPWGRSGR